MKPDAFDNDEKSQDQGGFLEKLDLATISDIFQLCKDEYGSRKLITLLYMILHYFRYQWRVTDNFLRRTGANRCETAHKLAETFLSGDFEAFLEDGRGGKSTGSSYDTFLELEIEAQAFVANLCA